MLQNHQTNVDPSETCLRALSKFPMEILKNSFFRSFFLNDFQRFWNIEFDIVVCPAGDFYLKKE